MFPINFGFTDGQLQNLDGIESSGGIESFGTAFEIGGFPIRWYGVFYALGILMAIIFIIIKLRTFYKIDDTPFYIFIFIAIPVIIFGARAWSFIIGDAKTGQTQFFDFRGGGLAIQGGIIFTTIAGIIWFSYILRKPKYFVHTSDEIMKNGVLLSEVNSRKVSMWVLADTILPAVLVGQALGRWGNFFNHEVYGQAVQTAAPTGDTTALADPNGPAFTQWGWLKNFMPAVWEHMWIRGSDGVIAFRVPIFLIESFMNVIGFLVMYYGLEYIRGYRAGTNASLYFIWTGIVRLVIEIFRDRNFKFETSIVTSSVFLALGVVVLILVYTTFWRFRKYRVYYFLWINTLGWFRGIYGYFKQKEIPNHLRKSVIEVAREWKKERSYYIRDFYTMYYYNDNIPQEPHVVDTSPTVPANSNSASIGLVSVGQLGSFNKNNSSDTQVDKHGK
ncbi:prolipoprotein diacylglyceryl transferase [[Mycoplasma] testudinis]|uniref:prolipoprotein diacylglyceryl transferase n=1 Tax=[Mycoplasma] testudinis TaxID=33924 RepID=UPI00069828DD|nr:prolipoprotein diacylglyceryl transferase [[Mycoplasma] testudinis]